MSSKDVFFKHEIGDILRGLEFSGARVPQECPLEWDSIPFDFVRDIYRAGFERALTAVAISVGLVIVLFLIFEPRGLDHRWVMIKNWYRQWPFSSSLLSGRR